MTHSSPRLTSSSSSCKPGAAALDARRLALGDPTRPADPDCCDLRAAIARIHSVDPEQILCGASAADLIGVLISGCVRKGDVVLGSGFDDSDVSDACERVQAGYERVAEIGYAVAVEQISGHVGARTRVVFLTIPGPLTGTLTSNAKLVELRAALPAEVVLAINQPCGEFSDIAQNRADLLALAATGNTVILRGFANAYGLGDAAVVWGCFPKDMAAKLRKFLSTGAISHASQAMATAAMLDQAHMRRNVQRVGDIRDHFARELRRMGIDVPPSYGDFVLLRFDSDAVAEIADQLLQSHGVVLRRMTVPGLTHCLRAPIGSEQEMERILGVLRTAAA